MALSENYRTETIGRSDCRPIVRLSADTIVRWDYRPNPSQNLPFLGYNHCNFCFNPLIIHGDMKENVSGFFSEHSVQYLTDKTRYYTPSR